MSVRYLVDLASIGLSVFDSKRHKGIFCVDNVLRLAVVSFVLSAVAEFSPNSAKLT